MAAKCPVSQAPLQVLVSEETECNFVSQHSMDSATYHNGLWPTLKALAMHQALS